MTIPQIKSKIKKDMKKYDTLSKISKNEDFRLAFSMISDYLKELIEEIDKK